LYNQVVKSYLTNPRSITDRALKRLRQSLDELGDLGGVVFDQNSGQIVGGHMRLRSMFGESAGEFNVQDADIELIADYDPPTMQGTIAEGFLRWRGGRYSFRKVRWDEATFRRANFVANQPAGDWDWNQIANTISITDLTAWGIDPSAWLAQLNTDAGAVRNMLAAEGYNPDLNPEFGGRIYTQKDVDEMASKLSNKYGNMSQEMMGVICPYCAKEFFVDTQDNKAYGG